MIELLKFISESILNYCIFVFTALFIYLLIVTIISVFFNKLMITIITIIREKSNKRD